MITREEVLRVCFDLAIVSRDGEILYLSDPSLEKVVSDFIEENRSVESRTTVNKKECKLIAPQLFYPHFVLE